jgi:hypothetical protein
MTKGPSTAADAAPWGTRLVEGIDPIRVQLAAGPAVRLHGHEVARHAGLSEVVGPKGWPQPGELAGLVAISDAQATACIPSAPWAYTKLRAHRFTGLPMLHADSVIELEAHSRAGTVLLWPCVAVETRRRDLTLPLPVPEKGPARAILCAASAAPAQ